MSATNMVLLRAAACAAPCAATWSTRWRTLLRDLDNGRCTFRRVLIETTGLADPAPVLHTAMAHPYLVMRYRLDGVVTVVDAVNGEATLDAHRGSGEAGGGRRPHRADQDRSRRYAGTHRRKAHCSRACARSIRPRHSRCRQGRGDGRARCSNCGLYDPGQQDPGREELARRRSLCAHAHDARPSSPSRRQPARRPHIGAFAR